MILPLTLRRAAAAALAGAAGGALEMSLRLLQGADPSVARRLVPLIAYGACLGGAVLLLASLLASTGAAVRRIPFASVMTGAVVALAAYVALVKTAGGLLWKSGTTVRWGALLGSAAAAVLLCWLVSRWLAGRPGAVARLERVFAPARIAAVSLAVLAAAAGIGFLATNGIAEAAIPRTTPAGGRQGRPDIILVMVDTLRADSVSALGGPAGSTPHVDALAERGVRFSHAVAPSPWTLPSVASLLTASDPRATGFADFSSAIPEAVATLPERLGAAGYQCLAVVGNPLVSIERGFSQGFELFDVHNYSPESRLFLSSAFSETLRLTGALGHLDRGKNPIPWLDARPPFLSTRLSFYVHDEVLNDRLFRYAPLDQDRPLFLYMHYISPHSPYLAHPFRFVKTMPVKDPKNRDLMIDLYRGEVNYMDSVLGDLLARLREAGRLDDAVIAFVADHGEEFLEHGRWEHGHNLFEESIHVPVVLSGEGLARRVSGFRPGLAVEQDIELIDVAPTLAALAGAPIPPEPRGGRDLLPLLLGAPDAYPARPIYSELVSRYLNEKDDYRSVQQDGLKVIRHRRPEGELVSEEAYNLRNDPGEKTPLTDWPEALRTLRAVLEDAESAAIRHTGGVLSEEELRKMRALGYVQ